MSDQPTDPLWCEPAALAAFLEERRPALLAFITQRLGPVLRGKLDPQDVAQEVAVKALREAARLDPAPRDPFAWLCHLAEQCVVDGHRHFAAEKRDAGREVPGNVPAGEASRDLIALLAASLTTPSQAVIRNERQRRLQNALASLPGEHREALRLRYVEGLPTKEVARRLNKTDVATRVLLTRLVQRLQELLGPGEEA
ncbi:MAG TPA: sigma-70 family RNA polymerase sigma factor [Urbifossiella sp.]|jgi:RNA polymerase sigma-70 factor (ECF subfamily)|nr:sigma-70 family RNA polymerase sigma factor [Urbifossiella sp.]